MNLTLRQQQLHFAKGLAKNQDAAAAQLTHPQRMTIYRNNVTQSSRQALQILYPTILKLVGEAFFNTAAAFYLAQYPSTKGDLNEYGDQFPSFINSYEPAKALPYLREVAELEWASHQVFYAANVAPFDVTTLTLISPDNYGDLKFQLHPACRLLNFRYPILKIWQLCQGGNNIVDNIDLSEGGALVLVWRRNFEVQMQALSVGSFELLSSFAKHLTLAQALENAIAAEPNLAIENCLRDFIAMEVLI